MQQNRRQRNQHDGRQIGQRETYAHAKSRKWRTSRDKAPGFFSLRFRHPHLLLSVDLIKGSAIAEVLGLRVLPSAASFKNGEGIHLGKDARVSIGN